MSNADKPQTFTGMACLWLAAAVAVGVGLAVAASSWVFEVAPNDLRRTKVLLDALSDESNKPQFVVMGNSVVMSGIDTDHMGELLALDEPGYNLATTGQNPVDSFLYYQNLPDSVELIVQFSTARFAVGRDAIETQKYNAMYMYGYRPDERTKAYLEEVFDDRVEDIFAMSGLEHRFLSRWAIKQAADNWVRQLARADLSFEASTYDLYSPNNGARRLSDDLMERALLRSYPRDISVDMSFGYRPNREKIDFYSQAGRLAADRNIDFVLAISPLHPKVHELYGEAWFADMRAFFAEAGKVGDFPVIDATDAIADEYFVDALHLSEAGAVVLSKFIAAEIQRLELTPGG
jgi:hypothetical protein